MAIGRSVIRACWRSMAHAFIPLTLLFALTLAQAGQAQSLYVVNPRPTERITSGTSVDATAEGAGISAHYTINGICHNADRVLIHIEKAGVTVGTDTFAVVKGGVWEYNWLFGGATDGDFTIFATPFLNGQAGSTQNVAVHLDGVTLPNMGLIFVPSGVHSSVFAGMGKKANDKYTLGVRLRYNNAGGALGKVRFAETTSTPITFDLNGALRLNNDDPNGNKDNSKVLPFSYAVGTASGLIDGLMTVTVDDGTAAPAAVFQRSIVIDYTPPAISASGSLNSAGNVSYPTPGIVRFKGKVNDPNNGTGAALAPGGIASVELYVQSPDDGMGAGSTLKRIPAKLTYGANPADDVNWSVDYDTTGLLPGAYKVYAVISDYAGNQTYDAMAVGGAPDFVATPFSINIDQKNLPTVTITAPSTNTYLKGTATVTFDANANMTVGGDLNYELHDVNGGVDTLVKAGSGHGAGLTATWDTTKAADGKHSIYVKVTDAQANTINSASVTVFVENILPTAAITAPSANAIISGKTDVTLQFSASVVDATNILDIEIKDELNNSVFSNMNFPNTVAGIQTVTGKYDTKGIVPDGTHTLTATVKDQAGNIATTTLQVIVDNTAPVISTIDTPLAGAFLPSSKVAISGTITDAPNTDPKNVIAYSIFDGATLIASGKGTPPFPLTFSGVWDTSSASEGMHTLTVKATDAAGNTATDKTVDVTVDKTAPLAAYKAAMRTGGPTYTVNATSIVQIIRDTVTLSGTYTEKNLAAANLTVTVDGKPLATTVTLDTPSAGVGTFSATWDTTTASDGAHTLSIVVTDKAGNTNKPTDVGTTLTAIVQNTAPTVTVTSPVSGATVPAGTTVTGVVSGNNVDLSKATFTFTYHNGASTASTTVDVVPTGGVASTAIPAIIGGFDTATPGSSVDITLTGADLATPPHVVTSGIVTVFVIKSAVTLDSILFHDFAGTAISDPLGASAVFVGRDLTVFGKVGILNPKQWLLVLSGAAIPTPLQIGGDGPTPPAAELAVTSKLNKAPTDPFDSKAGNTPDGTYTLTLAVTNLANPNTLTVTDLSKADVSVTRQIIIDNTDPVVAFGAMTPSDMAFVQNQTGSLITLDGTVTEANLDHWNFLIDGVARQTGTTTGAITFQPGAAASMAGSYLCDGPHTVQLEAFDKSGNHAATAVRTFVVDNIAPVVTYGPLTPSDGAFVQNQAGSLITIDGNVTEQNLNQWDILIDGTSRKSGMTNGAISLVPGAGAAYLMDGSHTLQIKATDKAGNAGQTAVRTITVDNTAPVVTFGAMTPSDGAIVRNEAGNLLTIDGTVTETNLKQWDILIDGVSRKTGMTTGAISFTPGAGVAYLVDGQHTIQITAEDKAGNKAQTAIRTITIQNTGPVVVVSSPTNGATVPVGSTTVGFISGANLDLSKATFTFTYHNGATTASTTVDVVPTGGVASTAIPAIIGGFDTATAGSSVDITLTGRDLVNPPHIVTSAVVTVFVIKSAVTLDEIDFHDYKGTGISDGLGLSAVFVGRDITVFGKVGILNPKQWLLLLGNATVGPIQLGGDGPTPAATQLPQTSKLNKAPTDPFDTKAGSTPDGTYTLTLAVTNTANPATLTAADISKADVSVTRQIIIDNTDPIVTFGAMTPSDVAFVQNQASTLITIDGTVTEINLDHWNILVDGVTRQTGMTAGPITFQPGAAASMAGAYLADGPHTIQIEAFDKAGNHAATAVRTIIVDNINPAVTFGALTPTDGAFVQNQGTNLVTIDGNITEINLKQWDILVDGISRKMGAMPGALTFTPGAAAAYLAEGAHTLQITASDKAGNMGQTAIRTITVDNTAPVVKFGPMAPSDGSVVQNQGGTLVTIDGTITETNLDHADILVDGASQKTVMVAGAITLVPGAGAAYLKEGAHQIQITAVDKAGNKGQTEVRTFVVDNTKPVVTFTSPSDGAFVRGTPKIRGSIADLHLKTYVLTDSGTAMPLVTDNTGTGLVAYDNWDTTKLADGLHTLKIQATDQAGNTDSASITVTVGNTPPTITLKTAQRVANSAIATPASPTPTDYTIGTPNPAGTASVIQVVRDVLQFTGTYTMANATQFDPKLFTVSVDGAVSPAVTITPVAPAGGTGTFTIMGLDTAALVDGQHSITLTVTDKSGNVNTVSMANTSTLNFIVDHTPPATLISSPSSGTQVPVTTPVIGSVSDVHLGGSASFIFSLPTPLWAGSPAGVVPTLPANASIIVPGTLVVNGGKTATYTTPFPALFQDGTRIAPGTTLEIRIVSNDTTTPANTGISDPVTAISASGQTVTLDNFIDIDGNARQSGGYFYIHADQYSVDGKIVAGPKPVDIIGTVNVPSLQSYTINVKDSNGVVFYTDTEDMTIDNKPLQPIVNSTKLNVHKPFDIVPGTVGEGPYTVEVIATDKGGATFPLNAGPANIVIDNSAPTFNFMSPADGAFLKAGKYQVTVAIDDNIHLQSNPLTTSILIDGDKYPNVALPALNSVSWDVSSPNVTEGKHTLTVQSADVALNRGFISRTVFVDRTPPTIQFNNLRDGQNITSPYRIDINLGDNISDPQNKLSLTVTIRGAKTQPTPLDDVTTPGLKRFMWGAVSNGDYIIDAQAKDMAGNVTNVSITVHVQVLDPVNGLPISILSLSSPVIFDGDGNNLPTVSVLSSPKLSQSSLNRQAVYLRGTTAAIGVEVDKATQINYSDSLGDTYSAPLTGSQLDKFGFTKDTNGEGLHTITLSAIQQVQKLDGPISILTATSVLDAVLDNTPPSVAILSPFATDPGQKYLVSPGGTLNITFRLDNTKPTSTRDTNATVSPLLSIMKGVSAPAATIRIYEVATNKEVIIPQAVYWNLLDAIQKPNTQSANGAATSSLDQKGSYLVNWQIPIQPSLFKLGSQYRIDIVSLGRNANGTVILPVASVPLVPKPTDIGLQDVVGNAGQKKSAYFNVNVN